MTGNRETCGLSFSFDTQVRTACGSGRFNADSFRFLVSGFKLKQSANFKPETGNLKLYSSTARYHRRF
jgi:hypothetical protein